MVGAWCSDIYQPSYASSAGDELLFCPLYPVRRRAFAFSNLARWRAALMLSHMYIFSLSTCQGLSGRDRSQLIILECQY